MAVTLKRIQPSKKQFEETPDRIISQLQDNIQTALNSLSTTQAAAKYAVSAASYSYTSPQPINFDQKIFDAGNNVTTGNNWSFNCGTQGVYLVTASIDSSTTGLNLVLYHNGKPENNLTAFFNASYTQSAATVVQLSQGDTVFLALDGNATINGSQDSVHGFLTSMGVALL